MMPRKKGCCITSFVPCRPRRTSASVSKLQEKRLHRFNGPPIRLSNIPSYQISQVGRDRHVRMERKTRPKVDNLKVCGSDIARKEWGDAVGHLVYHGPSAPPVCLDSISALVCISLLLVGLLIRHLHGNES